MRSTYIGEVRNGKLHLSIPRRQQMMADIAKMKDGRLVEVELRPLPRRSDRQNRYYWGVVVALVMEALQQLGHEVNTELTHEFLKGKFNAKPLWNGEGEVIGEIGETTTKMNRAEFGEYLEKIKRWSATFLSLYIPEPGEQMELTFEPDVLIASKGEGCTIIEVG